MKFRLLCSLLLFATSALAQAPPGPPTATVAQIEERVEKYLRNLFAWGPAFAVKIGPLEPAPLSGFYRTSVKVSHNGNSQDATLYVSKDGRFLFRGEPDDMLADPFASNRARIHLDGNPSKGPSNARVVVVEFSDFECAHCRLLYQTLKELEARYSQVRFVFKDFPLTEIHPWAMTAAIAARCAYQQDPEAFWKLHDAIFDNQDLISAENAWDKLLEFARDAGLQLDQFRGCMASPEGKQAVDANASDAHAVQVTSTPTLFVNGRPLIGGNKDAIAQYINFELHP
jgi:protein-disulfide isomerase